MFRAAIRYLALAGAIGVGACDLVVDNPNQPNTDKVLGTPSDAEALLGGYYKAWHQSIYGTGNPPGNFEGMANIMSLANYSSLANNCQNARTPFSGASNANHPGNPCAGDQNNPYANLNEVVRVASDVMARVIAAQDAGEVFLDTEKDARLLAFGEFLRGLSLGYLALFYDSAAVITPEHGGQDFGSLVGHLEVADSAYAALQRAIDHAESAEAGDDFEIPGTWLPSPTEMDAENFVRLIRSYRARFRANMGRNGTERAAADWPAIIADAQNGIEEDHENDLAPTEGMGAGWRRRQLSFGLWHQMPPFIIGMGDVSGSYAAWIAQPLGDRGAGNNGFFMVTPDQRFPQGATRAAQQADFAITSCNTGGSTCKRYFVNRPSGGDEYSGSGFGWSNYDYVRFYSWFIAGSNGTALIGPLPFFTKAELDMIQAEGHIRQGNYQAAADLINITRVDRGGLPEVTGTVTGGLAGADCVPRVPSGSTVACGNLMEAMKWEKRIETLGTHFGSWFLDSRGWNDLPEGTALFWAVPFQDLLARGYATNQIYGAGLGVGNAANSVAGPSTYGW
jgi:hypothetical protein